MRDLPIAARLFVAAVMAAGTLILVMFAPHTIANPLLFAILLACSSLASALKVRLPLASSGSTMSVSYAVDFAVGPGEAVGIVGPTARTAGKRNHERKTVAPTQKMPARMCTSRKTAMREPFMPSTIHRQIVHRCPLAGGELPLGCFGVSADLLG